MRGNGRLSARAGGVGTVWGMGMFDSVHTGNRCGQTKAFACVLDDIVPGTSVSVRASTGPNFQVALLRGSGFLTVRDGVFVSWDDEHDGECVLVNNRGELFSAWERPLARDSRPPDTFDLDMAEDNMPLPDQVDQWGPHWLFGSSVEMRAGEAASVEIERAERALSSAADLPHDCSVCAALRAGSSTS
jgi:hypothetical protein